MPHALHVAGIFQRRARFGRFAATGPTISGITSPARRTITVSPLRTSLRWTSSSLCSVAYVIVTPPTNTGSSTANGVTFPVRPVWTSIERRIVVRSSGGNLYAIAHRGAWDVAPSRCCSSVWSTLITVPSISQSIEWRCSSQCRRNPFTPSIDSRSSVVGAAGSPAFAAQSRNPRCDANETPSAAPKECTHIRSGRDAVTFGSFWRSEPAAALRGFAKARWSAAVSCSFRASNARTGRYISPRTSITSGGSSISSLAGTPRTVRTFAVMSSPMRPSPRVAAWTSRPRSYVSAHATPSIFSSHANRASSATTFATRAAHASSSSNENALSSESIGARCGTGANRSAGVAPTRCVGESGVMSSGNRSSSWSNSRISSS